MQPGSPRAARDPGAELAAYAAYYHARGLSSDTKILADFAVEDALLAFGSSGRLGGTRFVPIRLKE